MVRVDEGCPEAYQFARRKDRIVAIHEACIENDVSTIT
jgi:hypothetical protein